ncbi:MAG: hypothetical protein CMH56_16860 [Myxococcales bacterium]|nr:hypothetical protein [Myxococcales bacterium]
MRGMISSLGVFLLLGMLGTGQALRAEIPTKQSEEKNVETAPDLSLSAWLKTLSSLLDDTLRAQNLAVSQNALRQQQKSTELQTPFSIGANAYGMTHQKPDLSDAVLSVSPQPDRNGGISQTLSYADRNGWVGELQSGVDLANYFEGVVTPPERYNYSVAGTFSYDLIQGGDASPANLTANAAILTAHSQVLGLDANWARRRVEFLSLLTDVFVAKCQVVVVERLQPAVAEAVKVGKIQVETKTIGYIDYLNFLDLKNNFEQSRLRAQTALEQLIQSSGVWSVTLRNEVVRHLDKKFNCDDLMDYQAESKSILKATEDVEAITNQHPLVAAAKVAKDSAALDFDAIKKSQNMSLGPYVAANYNRVYFGEEGLGDMSAGLSLSYTPPGEQGKAELLSAQARIRQKKLEAAQARLTILAELKNMRQQLQRQVSIAELMRASLETSNELMKTLETQRALGFVNSLNYANAYMGQIRTQSAYLDSVNRLKKAVIQLDAIKLASEQNKLRKQTQP